MPLKCAPFMHWSTHGRRMRWQSLSQKVEGLASAVMHGWPYGLHFCIGERQRALCDAMRIHELSSFSAGGGD